MDKGRRNLLKTGLGILLVPDVLDLKGDCEFEICLLDKAWLEATERQSLKFIAEPTSECIVNDGEIKFNPFNKRVELYGFRIYRKNKCWKQGKLSIPRICNANDNATFGDGDLTIGMGCM